MPACFEASVFLGSYLCITHILPANVSALVENKETRKFLESLAPYCSEAELYNIAKEMGRQNLKLSLAINVEWRDEKRVKNALIPLEVLGENTLREIAP